MEKIKPEVVKFVKGSILIRMAVFALLGFILSHWFFAVSLVSIGEWLDLNRKLRKLNYQQ